MNSRVVTPLIVGSSKASTFNLSLRIIVATLPIVSAKTGFKSTKKRQTKVKIEETINFFGILGPFILGQKVN